MVVNGGGKHLLSLTERSFAFPSERMTPYTMCPARDKACATEKPMYPDALHHREGLIFVHIEHRTYPMTRTFMVVVFGGKISDFRD
jgi:hypothetical protein